MVLIAIPHTGYLRYSLVQRLLDFDKRDDVEIYMNTARPVDANRCEIVNYFMDETDHDRIVMIDSDIIPPDNLFEMLERYDEPILSPVIFSTENGVPYPAATMFSEEEGNLKMYTGEVKELTEVDGIGTGCIAIKREVFEEMEKPYFQYTRDPDGTVNTGEDFDFCVRAGELGYRPKVATEYTAGHITEADVEHIMELMRVALDANPSEIFVEEVG